MQMETFRRPARDTQITDVLEMPAAHGMTRMHSSYSTRNSSNGFEHPVLVCFGNYQDSPSFFFLLIFGAHGVAFLNKY